MEILIVGAGATGGYFGARLISAGRNVTFLVRPERARQLSEYGLQVTSPYGDVQVAPQVVGAADLARPFDLVLIAVKAYALSDAIPDFAAAVGPNTVIVPLLNGMRHLTELRLRFGDAVVGGLCRVHASLEAHGRIVQITPLHDLEYGEFNAEPSARIRAVDELLANAGFDTRLSQTIMLDMWEKWVLLATLGCATCLMRGSVGEIAAVPGGEPFLRALLAETSAVAAASGFAPRPAFVKTAIGLLLKKNSKMTSSMYRDLVAGRPVELDQILGDLLQRGISLQVATPLLQLGVTQLSLYQARLT